MKLHTLLLAAVTGLFLSTAVLSAADATPAALVGKWKVSFDSPMGPQEIVYTFKSDGGKLTGTSTSEMAGELTLTEVKFDKDTVTFVETITFNDMSIRFEGSGKLAGDELSLKRRIADFDFTQEGVAKRVKEEAPAAAAPAPAPAQAPAAAKK